MNNMNNEKNKSSVILNPERSEWVSRSHITGVEIVVNDGAKTKRYSAKRDLYARSPNGSRLKMTRKVLSFLRLRGASDIVGIEGVITRRTSVRRGYLPEQCTHANKESLFASVTCFMRLPRRIQRMLLVMTIPALTFLLTLITTTESRAEIIASGDDCAANDGVSECHWEIVSTTDANGTQSQTLNISGKGNMKNYKYLVGDDKPWGNYTVSSIKVDGVDSIGQNAFSNLRNVNDVEIGNSVTTIKQYAFSWTGFSSISMSDNLKNLNMSALRGTNLTEIILPYTTNIAFDSLGEHLINVTCLGDEQKCTNLKNQLKNYQYDYDGIFDLDLSQDGAFSIAGKEKCNTENYYWDGKGCEKTREDGSKPCANDYVSYKNECLSEYPFAKKRWTPAEANEWLHDGNDNFVVITFKK